MLDPFPVAWNPLARQRGRNGECHWTLRRDDNIWRTCNTRGIIRRRSHKQGGRHKSNPHAYTPLWRFGAICLAPVFSCDFYGPYSLLTQGSESGVARYGFNHRLVPRTSAVLVCVGVLHSKISRISRLKVRWQTQSVPLVLHVSSVSPKPRLCSSSPPTISSSQEALSLSHSPDRVPCRT